MGGITIWGMAEESGSKARSESKSKSKSKAAGESPASTQVSSTHANSTHANSTHAGSTHARSTQPGQRLTPKQLGEIAEAEFIAKAVGLGFVVARPWGDSEPYDFIVNPKKSFIFGGCR